MKIPLSKRGRQPWLPGGCPSIAKTRQTGKETSPEAFSRLRPPSKGESGKFSSAVVSLKRSWGTSMMVKNILTEIRDFCRENADPARVRKYARYFVEGYDAYGVDRELMEKQRELWLQEHRQKLGFEGFLKLGDLLVENGKYEEASFAIWFAAAFKDDYTPETLERLGQWLDNGFRNWAHTDVFSGEVLSSFIVRGIVRLKALSLWRNASSRWKRRAVPVTLIKGLQTDLPVSRLLEFISPMMLDSERVVQQGLGWFLREAWKISPSPVEKFLLKWKDSCGRLIVQYATEKMSAEKKGLFKRSKQ
jgi:3-methyladenine DNA glycosylase AlkD